VKTFIYYSGFGNAGGPTVQVRSYAKALLEAGHNVTIGGLGRPWWRPISVGVEGAKYVPGSFLPKSSWFARWGLDQPAMVSGRLVRHLQENSYDIVHCVGWRPGTAYLLWAAKANGAKTLYTATGPGDRPYAGGFENAGFLLDGVHAPAKSVVETIASRMGCKGGEYVFPIAPDRLRKCVETSPDNPLSMAFLGHLDKHKKVDRLVALWSNVVEKEREAHLHLFGAGGLEIFLRESVKKSGLEKNVTFHGYQPDLEKVFSQVSILIVMAKEGLSLAAVEALCAGRSVILPSDGLFPEVYGNCSAIDFFAPDASDDELSEFIVQSMSRASSETKREAAIKYYEENFSPEVVGRKLLECYQDLVDR